MTSVLYNYDDMKVHERKRERLGSSTFAQNTGDIAGFAPRVIVNFVVHRPSRVISKHLLVIFLQVPGHFWCKHILGRPRRLCNCTAARALLLPLPCNTLYTLIEMLPSVTPKDVHLVHHHPGRPSFIHPQREQPTRNGELSSSTNEPPSCLHNALTLLSTLADHERGVV